jgi:hypothetical protein
MEIGLLDQNNIKIGSIFLVHGHQGYCFKRFSRFIVRYFWRPFQRITNIRSTTPANDSALRGKLNLALYDWAFDKNDKEKKKLVLIAGHTHHPVFASRDHIGKIEDELRILEEKYMDMKKSGHPNANSIEKKLADKRILLEERRRRDGLKGNQIGISMEKPCYFNTGCCSYSDGDITGIEVSNSSIRLVKWSRTKTQLKVLEDADINRDIFNKL